MNDLLDAELPDLPEVPEIRALIGRATSDLHAPTGLDDAARRRGLRLRARRSALIAGGALVAVAGAVVAVAVPLAGGSERSAPIATEPTVSTAPALPGPTAGVSPFVHKAGWWDRPASSMEKVLRGLLPKGTTITSFATTSDDRAPGEDRHLVGELTGTLAGPTGPGAFEIRLIQLPDGDWHQATLAVEHAEAEAIKASGTPSLLPPQPGALAAWGKDVADSPLAGVIASDFACPGDLPADASCGLTSSDTQDTINRRAELRHDSVIERQVNLHAGGGELTVAVANATDRTWQGPATASQPPLTLVQLTDIAESPIWTAWGFAE